MTELILFATSYCIVFALGFQSRNVNEGHYALAFVTNAMIGLMNVVVLKMVPNATGWTQVGAYVAGGPLGIVTAIWVHKHYVRRK